MDSTTAEFGFYLELNSSLTLDELHKYTHDIISWLKKMPCIDSERFYILSVDCSTNDHRNRCGMNIKAVTQYVPNTLCENSPKETV